MKIQNPKGNVNTVMVVLLIVASFLIGSLFTRVKYMEKGNTSGSVTGQKAPEAVSQAPSVNTAPVVSADKIPPITNKDHIKGDKNATVVLIEYSDFECPFCKRFHPTMQQAMDEYQGKVKWVYRHYPLPFHQNAQMEAEASECANEQGGNEAFWKYGDALYEKTSSTGTSFTKEQLVAMAGEQGLDTAKITECLDSGRMKKVVTDQMTGGQKAGIEGTPGTFILNTATKKVELVPGALPYEDLKKSIEKVL